METREPLETILVVDDNRFILELVVAILKRQNYRVLSASSGDAALEIAASHSLDMLLADVQMPIMTGPELARRLRRQMPELHILLMSGGATREDFDAEDWHFLEKPFSPTILVRTLRKILHTPGRLKREMANVALEMHAS